MKVINNNKEIKAFSKLSPYELYKKSRIIKDTVVGLATQQLLVKMLAGYLVNWCNLHQSAANNRTLIDEIMLVDQLVFDDSGFIGIMKYLLKGHTSSNTHALIEDCARIETNPSEVKVDEDSVNNKYGEIIISNRNQNNNIIKVRFDIIIMLLHIKGLNKQYVISMNL